MDLDVELRLDSSAATALTNREGLGKATHIAIQDHWVQEALKEKHIGIAKVAGTENLADIGTKSVPSSVIEYWMNQMGYFFG